MTLKLLLYSHYWAPSIGGIQTIMMGLATGLAGWSSAHPHEKIEVSLITQTPASSMDDAALPFPVIRQPTLSELARCIQRADVIHLANPALAPLALGWLMRRPVVIEHDGYPAICPNGLLIYEPDRSLCPGHFMARRYQMCLRCNSGVLGWAGSVRNLVLTFPRRWLARRVAANVAPSRHIGNRVSLPRTRFIYHGVPVPGTVAGPPERVGSGANSICEAGSDECRTFTYIGRLVQEKGVSVLLRAASQAFHSGYELRLRIVGDGPQRSELEQLAIQLGIGAQTEFTGSVAPSKVPDVLKDSAAVIMPSVCEDVAPLVAIEQMMQGRLLIAADIGGLGEIVNGFGLKFPAGDADALAACMRKVLENPGLATILGEKARRHSISTFDENRCLEEHVSLYHELVQPR